MTTGDASESYDVIIIGCGMAGLAAGIRLGMYGKSVLILERHNAPGGLNSFYSIDGRPFDVGLHALTNYVPAGVKGTPLTKLLRQLRIRREDLQLRPQIRSRIAFPGIDLVFDNGIERLETDIAQAFPQAIDRFRKFRKMVLEHDGVALDSKPLWARPLLREHLREPVLEDMLLVPLTYYGSAHENDLEFDQFAILWRSLFEEGFARPPDGVRVIIRALLQRLRETGVRRRMKSEVQRIETDGHRATAVVLTDGSRFEAQHILSTAGLVETMRLCDDRPPDTDSDAIGRLSFCETITVMDRRPSELGWDDTIIFFNDSERFHYERPETPIDTRSGVICFPNNYRYEAGEGPEEGLFRVTVLANHPFWSKADDSAYAAQKRTAYDAIQKSALRFLGGVSINTLRERTKFVDMFTPRTITKYTGHLGGAVYGASRKSKTGRTHLDNLYLAGTDQGFLGITGAILSGISMANLHVLASVG